MANAAARAAAATLNGRRGRNTQHTLDVDEEFMHFSGLRFAGGAQGVSLGFISRPFNFCRDQHYPS